ncbi:MAG: branched-chain amino acid ABC transporter permease [Thaumarchaeota archaeon]|nr:branched-chain amino acid ABC transporter permease [Nitrososphaerota archaeon]
MQVREIILSTIVLATMLPLPFLSSSYIVFLMSGIMVLALCSLSFNLVYANTGYLNLGNSVPFGVGAYTFASTLSYDWPLPLVLVASLSAILISGALSGIFIIRLKGAYYAIGTLALVLFAQALAYNLGWLTGGYQGIIVNVAGGSVYSAYFILAFLNTLLLLLTSAIRKSSFGYRIRSIKGNELAARTFGINTTTNKFMVLLVSSVFVGIAGILSTFYNGFVTPESSFGISITFLPIIAAILLGSSSIAGPLIGVLIITLASEIFVTTTPQLTHLVLGILLILVALYQKNIPSLRNSRLLKGKLGVSGANSKN